MLHRRKELTAAWNRYFETISTIQKEIAAWREPVAGREDGIVVLDFDRFAAVVKQSYVAIAEITEAELACREGSEGLPEDGLKLLLHALHRGLCGTASDFTLQGISEKPKDEPEPGERERLEQFVFLLHRDGLNYFEVSKRLDQAGIRSPWHGLSWTGACRLHRDRVKTWISKAVKRFKKRAGYR